MGKKKRDKQAVKRRTLERKHQLNRLAFEAELSLVPGATGSLLWAVYDKQSSALLVESAIAMGADPNYVVPDWRMTPLIMAACHGRGDIVEILLANGARSSMAERDASGWNVLDYACMHGHLSMIRLLMNAGARGTSDDPISPIAAAGVFHNFDSLAEFIRGSQRHGFFESLVRQHPDIQFRAGGAFQAYWEVVSGQVQSAL